MKGHLFVSWFVLIRSFSFTLSKQRWLDCSISHAKKWPHRKPLNCYNTACLVFTELEFSSSQLEALDWKFEFRVKIKAKQSDVKERMLYVMTLGSPNT